MSAALNRRFKQAAAAVLSASLILLSPGLGVYDVLAGALAVSAASSKAGGTAASSLGVVGGLRLSPSSVQTTLSNVKVSLAASLPITHPRSLTLTAPVLAVSENGVAANAVQPIAPVAAIGDPRREGRPWLRRGRKGHKPPRKLGAQESSTEASVLGMSVDVYAAMGEIGSVPEAGGEDARRLGSRLQSILSSGLSGRAASSSLAVPRAGAMRGLRHRFGLGEGSRHFGDPAGKGSIEAGIRSHRGEGPSGAASPDEVEASESGNPTPLWARVAGSVIGAVPITILTAALWIAGAPLAAAGVAIAGFGLITMPFFGPQTPVLIRTLPGVFLTGLGLWTAGGAVLAAGAAFTGSGAFWMGAMSALGGWGLIRFGKLPNKRYFDEEKVLTAFFGALFAIVGAGLVAVSPAVWAGSLGAWIPFLAGSAWTAAAIKIGAWAGGIGTVMLFMHLPGWVGEGIATAVSGIFQSVRGALRVTNSIKRDTTVRRRLERWTEAKLDLSKWNIFKVGAVWIPVWIGEGLSTVAGFVAGLAFGIPMAIPMFLWGAFNELRSDAPEGSLRERVYTRLNNYFAALTRFVFYKAQGSKKSIYNRVIRLTRLNDLANSEAFGARLAGAFGMKVFQAAWLAYSLAATVPLYILGAFYALSRTGAAYDPEFHSPDSIRGRQQGDSIERPELPEEGPPVVDVIPPGIFATMLAALPLAFFGLPLWQFPLLGLVYAAAAIGVGASPLMPERTPKILRQVPGYALSVLGVTLMAAIPWLTFGPANALTFLVSNSFWMGFVTALAGLGWVNNISKIAKKKKRKYYSADDPEVIGAFFGGMGVLVGAGLATAGGLAGWYFAAAMGAAYLTSLLLLIHLPKWVWSGAATAFKSLGYGISRFREVFGFWYRDTEFYDNLKSHKDYHLRGTFWEVLPKGILLGFIWIPTGVVMLAELAAAVAFGLSVGLVRAPINWLWGASYKFDPELGVTRFISGFARSLAHNSEGSKKKFFDPLVRRLIPAMNDKKAYDQEYARPTAKAVGAFALARVAQLLWLALGVAWGYGAIIALVLSQYFALPVWLTWVLIGGTGAYLLRGVYDGIRNMLGEKKLPDPDADRYEDDRDDPGGPF